MDSDRLTNAIGKSYVSFISLEEDVNIDTYDKTECLDDQKLIEPLIMESTKKCQYWPPYFVLKMEPMQSTLKIKTYLTKHT